VPLIIRKLNPYLQNYRLAPQYERYHAYIAGKKSQGIVAVLALFAISIFIVQKSISYQILLGIEQW